MAAAGEVNQKENGDMKVIAGYISYEDQMKLFEKAKLVYGEDVLQHWIIRDRVNFSSAIRCACFQTPDDGI